MKRIACFLISLFTLFAVSCGPGERKTSASPDFDPLIQPIKEAVQQTDTDPSLETRTLLINEANTTGKYIGYFKKGELVKFVVDGTKPDGMKHWVFYLQDGQLVHVHIKETSANCHGTKFCAWECKNYFLSGHLVKSLKRGDAFVSEAEAKVEEKNFTQNFDDDMMQMDTTQQQYAGYVVSLFNQQKK